MKTLSSWKRSQLVLPSFLLAAFLYLGTYHQPLQEGQAATITALQAALDARDAEEDGVTTSSADPERDASEFGVTISAIKTSEVSDIGAPKRVYVPLIKKSKEGMGRSKKGKGRSKKGKVAKGKRKAWWPVELLPSNASVLQNLGDGRYTPQDQRLVKARVQVQVERVARVTSVCRTWTDQETTAGRLVWRLDQSPSMVWCPRYSQPREPDQSNNPTTGKEKAEAFRRSLRVIFVSHPFTRIITAYLEKMVSKHPTPPKYRKLQQTIVFKYRPLAPSSRSSRTSRGPVFPTFPEFVQHIIDSTTNFTTSKQWRQTVTAWTPYWAECGACNSDYNLIMKQETMAEDLRFLATLTDLIHSEELVVKAWGRLGNETWARKAAAESLSTGNSSTMKLFSLLTRQQMKELYTRYEIDFQLFGYTIDDYLVLATDAAAVD